MLPADYTEKVYRGVMVKIIDVYLGRPFEGWVNEAKVLDATNSDEPLISGGVAFHVEQRNLHTKAMSVSRVR